VASGNEGEEEEEGEREEEVVIHSDLEN